MTRDAGHQGGRRDRTCPRHHLRSAERRPRSVGRPRRPGHRHSFVGRCRHQVAGALVVAAVGPVARITRSRSCCWPSESTSCRSPSARCVPGGCRSIRRTSSLAAPRPTPTATRSTSPCTRRSRSCGTSCAGSSSIRPTRRRRPATIAWSTTGRATAMTVTTSAIRIRARDGPTLRMGTVVTTPRVRRLRHRCRRRLQRGRCRTGSTRTAGSSCVSTRRWPTGSSSRPRCVRRRRAVPGRPA